MTTMQLNRRSDEINASPFLPTSASSGADFNARSDPLALNPALRSEGEEAPSEHNILIVDESPGLLALLCALLHSKAAAAASLKEAEDLARRHSFDLIIIDYHLPEGDGLSVLHRLRAMGIMAPAIVMTDEPRLAEFLKISFLNIKKVLVKPFTFTAFKTAMEEALRK